MSQGVYYNLLAGFSIGIDVHILPFLTNRNGTHSKTTDEYNNGNNTIKVESSERQYTDYGITYMPTLGLRYSFGASN